MKFSAKIISCENIYLQGDREPEIRQRLVSMAERQRIGRRDTWQCDSKQTLSLRLPICFTQPFF